MASTEPLSPQRSLLESLPFYRFCQGLELAAVHSRAIDKLAQVFPDKVQESVETELAAGRPCSWYPLMRLLIPDADRTRHKYNIGLKNLQVMIVEKILLLPREAPAAQKVYNFTNPNVAGSLAARQRSNRGSGSTTSGAGDFAQVIENVLEPRRKGLGRTLTIGDVNAKLDALATATTGDERFVVMTDLYNNFSANEMKWTLRIILKNMMIGLKKAVVLKWYHPDAADYYDACNQLEQVLDSAFATPGLPHAPSLALHTPALHTPTHKPLRFVRDSSRLDDDGGRGPAARPCRVRGCVPLHTDVFSIPVFHVPGGHLLWHTVLDDWPLPAVE
jgi:hypothetical protein